MAADAFADLKLPWPDQDSIVRPGESVRVTLDYICFVADQMLAIGFHAGSRRDEWRRRVHTAYVAMFRPIVVGHGDPYPPDVPPAKNPGIWPDVPASAIPGMTLRHQITVIRMLCHQIRSRDWLHTRKTETDEWEHRLARIFAALDHGESMPVPDEAKTEPSPEVLEAARIEHTARADRVKGREEQLRKQMARMRKKKAEALNPPKKKVAPKKAAAAPTTPAPKKKVAKKAAAKKTAKKKAVAKKTAKKTAKKKAVAKKTATKKKAAPKKAAAKKKAKAKKTAKKR